MKLSIALRSTGICYGLLIIALAGLCFCAAPAHAGNWAMGVSATGAPADSSYPSYFWFSYVPPTLYNPPVAVTDGNGANNQNNGAFETTLYWIPSSSSDTSLPANKVSVLVSANASDENYGSSSFLTGAMSVSADNGFGDADSVQITDPTQYTSVFNSAASSGLHIVQAQVTYGSGTTQVYDSNGVPEVNADGSPVTVNYTAYANLPTIQPSASGSATLAANNDWNGFSLIDMQYAIDPRSMSLSRPGAIGETVDADGTVHGDTIYSMHNYSDYGDPPSFVDLPTLNTQTFVPSFSTGWGYQFVDDDGTGHAGDIPNVTWTWDPNNSSDIWDSGLCQMPYGTLDTMDGDIADTADSSQTYDVTYTATSNVDGAIATAKYELTLHDPDEFVSDSQSNQTATGPLYGSDPNSSDNTLDIVHGYAPQGSQTVSKGTTQSSGWSESGGLSYSWLKIWGVNFQASHTTNSGTSVSASTSLPFDVPEGEYTYPIFTDTYVRTIVLYRAFTEAGETTKDSSGNIVPDQFPFDQYAGSSISWVIPISNSVPVPIQDPDTLPYPTTPEPG